MALQSHAALAQIRDSLLETYASNDAMNQLILSDLDPRAWRAQPLGQKGSGTGQSRPSSRICTTAVSCG
jgi:hypothetical protein